LKPSVRPTFVSAKVGKTIFIRKTRQIAASNQFIAETLEMNTSCLKQLRMNLSRNSKLDL